MSKRKAYPLPIVPEGTPHYWRSLEERSLVADEAYLARRAAEPEFELEVEAPSHVGRRGFLSGMGAALAALGASGCRRPAEHIVPFVRSPEGIVPGKSLHYATALDLQGEAVGLVVETHEGRPTKVEGNPGHPASLGAVDAIGQAAIFDLYDPDRLKAPTTQGRAQTWPDFENALRAAMGQVGEGGEGLYLYLEPSSSPTLERLLADFSSRFPRAQVVFDAVAHSGNVHAGTEWVFGEALEPSYQLDQAKVIVSLDADFLATEKGSARSTRLFARSRTLRKADDSMSRLYAVGPALTLTAANADHHLRLGASQVLHFAAALAARLAAQGVPVLASLAGAGKRLGDPEGVPATFLEALAKDLKRAGPDAVVVPGWQQPSLVHAVAHLVNAALGSVGRTVRYAQAPLARVVPARLRALAQDLAQGKVKVLLSLSGNLAFTAPGELGLSAQLARASFSAHLSPHADETAAACTWQLPLSHPFEAWGDLRSSDGTAAVGQPLIQPLYDSRSALEVLAAVLALPQRRGLDLVRATHPGLDERTWRKALRDGLLFVGAELASPVIAPGPTLDPALAAIDPAPRPALSALEVVFALDPKLGDGRHAGNVWLQELPDPVTKLVWDNAALVSPTTAAALGVRSGDVLALSLGASTARAAAWVLPGMADHCVVIPLGWGRRAGPRHGVGRGFDAYPLRTVDAPAFARGLRVERTSERFSFAQTQEHHSMEGRPLAREATLPKYRESPQFARLMVPPPDPRPLWPKAEYQGHKWGLSIDLNACTGCSACVVACQGENNIGVVGKDEVALGRELHWLRIDRYFVGDEQEPKVAFQPVACQQCEEAPCENVCPVNATAHSPEGLNDMAYNRCIGTRYCANNCPYKVRRFNYRDNVGELWGTGLVLDENKKLPPSLKLAQNPDVTVRMRGVMEKCTYCVQRIQKGRIDARNQGRPLGDGDVVPACAQTCPAEAIVFGDLNDPSSRVARLAKLDRHYHLLGELGVAPRTTYLAKVRNPNPELDA